MIRRIVHIDEEKCNGCGLCAQACHESAIGMVNGKAKLLRDDYCDGLGDCLPACPAGAISFIEREAAAYDEAAVLENKKKKAAAGAHPAPAGGCPGTRMRQMNRKNQEEDQAEESALSAAPITSQLSNWPVQIKLAPIKAPYFDQAKLLIAADCTAYAYGNFHKDFVKGKVTLIGCPKLDDCDYSEKFIPWQVVTISIDGPLLDSLSLRPVAGKKIKSKMDITPRPAGGEKIIAGVNKNGIY